ncbi:hypothetical protein R1sor_003469 [Riccia sorocarpa]|uniref:LOB domain-containing protein n=1 Tax=Riccia sorocarpa TaxID=122646 RepID=A0ABD3H4N2_9MARC
MVSGLVGACAACKHQKRRCREECPLARWFPPYAPERFFTVNKLFGVKNVMRMIKENSGNEQDLVMSLVYEAEARQRDPVYGAYGVLQLLEREANQLEQMADQLKMELLILKEERLKSTGCAAERESKLFASVGHIQSTAHAYEIAQYLVNEFCCRMGIPSVATAGSSYLSADPGESLLRSIWMQSPIIVSPGQAEDGGRPHTDSDRQEIVYSARMRPSLLSDAVLDHIPIDGNAHNMDTNPGDQNNATASRSQNKQDYLDQERPQILQLFTVTLPAGDRVVMDSRWILAAVLLAVVAMFVTVHMDDPCHYQNIAAVSYTLPFDIDNANCAWNAFSNGAT